MKILHFAIENYARVPANLVKAEKALGHESYLMTLYHTFQSFNDEDICLDLPFVATAPVNYLRRLLVPQKTTVSNLRRDAALGAPIWKPPNALVAKLFAWRDNLWEAKIRKVLQSLSISAFDVLFLDGGCGFLRSGKIVRELKDQGLKIITCYCGSDLRTRGIIPAVDGIADCRFTFEYDHTLLYPQLKFMYFPFELGDFAAPERRRDDKIRIGHAPTNRQAKGTEEILRALRTLESHYPIEIVLIENLPHHKALTSKASCDLFVDTVGELGYGVNSLEALAMGIPTAVQLLPDFEQVLRDHPFINISSETIAEKLVPFIESKQLRKNLGEKGREWVKTHHNPVNVSKEILRHISNDTPDLKSNP